MPTLITANVTNVTQTSATCGGTVIDDGGTEVTERGVCWSLSHNPTENGSHATSGAGTGSFTVDMTGLTPNTTYFARAYAKNSEGTAYGNEVSFTTLAGGGGVTQPTVTTADVTNVTMTEATCGGTVIDDGGATVTERGVCWSTSPNPTETGSHATGGTGTGSFTVDMTGLTPNTTYYARAYAKNSQYTGYGEQKTFTTQSGGGSATQPTVTTADVTDVTQTSATCGGTVIDDGGATVTTKGICWNTTGQPTLADSHTNDGSGMGSFASQMTGLTTGTTYYVRAYAGNSEGTAYGNEVTFTTLSGGGSNGLFSVSATRKVHFAPGNLQYNNGTWNFAEHQYDYLGTWTNGGAIDYFGWGTWTGSNPNPYNLSEDENDYTFDPADFQGTVAGYESYNWRTLTNNEWTYVFDNRNTPSGIRYAKANVNNVNGVILLPDDWNTSTYPLNSTNDYNSNVITASQWITLENAGAVFLPASGCRLSGSPTLQYVGSYGFYWSSTLNSNGNPYSVYFQSGSLNLQHGDYRRNGRPVRLVYTDDTPSPAPEGAIDGLFTINGSGDQVYFSQGNLQYQASNGIWRFATNQYDYIGDANSNISSSYSGWIDLFGWGTSGWNCGNTYYRPWDSDNSNGSLYGPPGQYNLTGSYANSDWGRYNAISNGGNTSNTWRTLTQSEWDYVFNTRSTNSGIRYAKAQVNNVNGVILLPDNWSSSYYTLYSTNQGGASFSSNVISSSTWTNSLQSHGAVFLPAAGDRYGTSVDDVGSQGYYWSASYYGSGNAYRVGVYDGYLETDNVVSNRCYGFSVRLVCPAQ